MTDSLEAGESGKTTLAGNRPPFFCNSKEPFRGRAGIWGLLSQRPGLSLRLLAERPALRVVNGAPPWEQSRRMGHPSLGPLSLCQVPSSLSLPYLRAFLMNPSLTMKARLCGLEFGNYLGVEKMTDWLLRMSPHLLSLLFRFVFKLCFKLWRAFIVPLTQPWNRQGTREKAQADLRELRYRQILISLPRKGQLNSSNSRSFRAQLVCGLLKGVETTSTTWHHWAHGACQ